MTREPDFLKSLYQKYMTGKPGKYWIKIYVTIGSKKETSQVEFYSYEPNLEYKQHDHNSCCFSCLESAFVVSEYSLAAKAIRMRITAWLSYESHDYIDRIKFTNVIMDNKERNKRKQYLRYK